MSESTVMGRVRASFGVLIGALALGSGLALRASAWLDLPAILEQGILPWAALALALAAVLSAWVARPTAHLVMNWGLLPLAAIAGLTLCGWAAFDLSRSAELLPAGLEAAGGFALIVSGLRFYAAQAARAVAPAKLGGRRKVRLIREGQKKKPEVPVASLEVNDLVEVKTGADVPVDGDIMQGSGFVDESELFGPILPTAKKPTDAVFAGTHSTVPDLVVRTRRPLSEGLMAQREERLAALAEELTAPGRVDWTLFGISALLAVLVAAAPLLGEVLPTWPTLLQVGAGCVLAVVVAAPALASRRARLSAAGWTRAHGLVVSRAKDLEALMAVRRWQVDPFLLAAPGPVEVVALDDTPQDTLLAVTDALLSESYGPEQISVRAALEDKKLERLQPAAVKKDNGVHRATVNGRRWYLGSEGALEGEVEITDDLKGPLQFLRDKSPLVYLVGRDDDGVLGAIAIGTDADGPAAEVARALEATVMPGLPDGVRAALAAAADITCDGPPLGKHDASLLTTHAALPSSGARVRVVEPASDLVLPAQAAPRVFAPALGASAPAFTILPKLREEANRRRALCLLVPPLVAAPLAWLLVLGPSLGLVIGLAAVVFAGRAYPAPAGKPEPDGETGSAVIAAIE